MKHISAFPLRDDWVREWEEPCLYALETAFKSSQAELWDVRKKLVMVDISGQFFWLLRGLE